MARPTGSSSRAAETRFQGNRAAAGDPAPETDEISGTRADYAPTGADPSTTTVGTLKRTAEGVQRGQPHRLGRRPHLLRRAGALPGPDRAAVDHRPAHRPEDAHRRADRRRPGERRRHAQPGHRGPGRQHRSGRLRPGPRSGPRHLVGVGLRRRLHARRQRRLRDARRPQDLEAQAAAAADHAHRRPVRRRDRRDAGAQRPGRRRDRAGHRHRRDRADHLEHRQVAGRPRRPGADDRRPLLLDAERQAARLQVGQPRCRRRHRGGDRRVGAVRVLRRATSAATTRPTARWPASSSS